MKFIIYQITNNVNGRYYRGAHVTNNVHDTYMGSGDLIRKAIKKYGIEKFSKTILAECSTIEEMYKREKELVVSIHLDPLSYNVNDGGHGGGGHVNKAPNRIQCMHNPEIAKRVSDSLKKRYADPKNKKNLLKRLALATEAARKLNTGKKRPEHAALMKKLHDEGKLKMEVTRTPSTFLITDPGKRNYTVYNLQEFCYNNGLPYNTIWSTSISGNPAKKGKAKGWVAKLIKKGHYE